MTIRRGLLATGWMLALLVGGARKNEAAEKLDQVAAVVEDRVITLYDVRQARRWMEADAPTFRETLDHLVAQTMIDREIEKVGIQITDAEIDRALHEIVANQGGDPQRLVQQLELAGTSMEEYRKSIADQLKQVKVVNQRVRANVAVTEGEILEEYQKRTASGAGTRSADLQIIVLPGRSEPEYASAGALAKSLHARLREGVEFGELARKYSQGPSPELGGKLEGVEEGSLQPTLDRAIFTLEEGKFSEPLGGQGAWFLVKLLHRSQRNVAPLEQMKPQITDDLYRKKFDTLFQAWVSELKNRTTIKILVEGDPTPPN